MPSIPESIETALFTRALGLAAITGLPIAAPNVDFPGKNAAGQVLPKPARYLRVDHLPNRSQRPFINDAEHLRPGILQIMVVIESGMGKPLATRYAGQVAAHFPMDLKLVSDGVTVRISKEPDIAGPLKDDTSFMLPVSVSYETRA
jgi:hypothetical protein